MKFNKLLLSLSMIVCGCVVLLNLNSCKQDNPQDNSNERDWNKGVKFENLKLGDDLSDKSISFDMTKNWFSLNYTPIQPTTTWGSYSYEFIKFDKSFCTGYNSSGPFDGAYQYTYYLTFPGIPNDYISTYDPNTHFFNWHGEETENNWSIKYKHNNLIFTLKYPLNVCVIQSLSMELNYENDNLNDYILNDMLFGYF